MNLKYFTPTNGVYPGSNEPQFLKLEYLIETFKTTGIKPPHLALFGEASSGKTSSITRAASFMGVKLVSINCADLTLSNLSETLFTLASSGFYAKDSKGNKIYSLIDNSVILLDEAHELDKKLQTLFLSLLDNSKTTLDILGTRKLRHDNVTWVFATTDSSKLLQPLITRLDSIYFQQYTIEDIQNMIQIKYPNICSDACRVIASCSKSIPRVALRYSGQIVNICKNQNVSYNDSIEFAKNYLNMDQYGIDKTDHRILLFLSKNKKDIPIVDQVSLEVNKKTIETLSALPTPLTVAQHKLLNRAKSTVGILEIKASKSALVPRSRQDISLGCKILDLKELEVRLTFLEQLNMIRKTPQGILLND